MLKIKWKEWDHQQGKHNLRPCAWCTCTIYCSDISNEVSELFLISYNHATGAKEKLSAHNLCLSWCHKHHNHKAYDNKLSLQQQQKIIHKLN